MELVLQWIWLIYKDFLTELRIRAALSKEMRTKFLPS